MKLVNKLQSAAMFGLDARIALAIFGALSVITGIVLYNVIQDVKVTATITDLEEIGKAYDAYLLDTGTQIPIIDLRFLDVQELLVSNKLGWKGPYLTYEIVSNNVLKSSSYVKVHIFYRPGTDWGTSMNGTPNIALPASCDTSPCYIWPTVYIETELAKKIDKKVDGVLNGKSGNVRLNCGVDLCYVYYKYAPAIIQP